MELSQNIIILSFWKRNDWQNASEK